MHQATERERFVEGVQQPNDFIGDGHSSFKPVSSIRSVNSADVEGFIDSEVEEEVVAEMTSSAS